MNIMILSIKNFKFCPMIKFILRPNINLCTPMSTIWKDKFGALSEHIVCAIFWFQTKFCVLSARFNTTNYSYITGTMNKEEKRRTMVINGPSAGRTEKEILQFYNAKKSTVYEMKKKWDAHIAAGGSPLMILK
jgi:hypothetical protein